MDVDAAGELGRAVVVEPVVIGEPRAGLGDDDELARALVVDAVAGLLFAIEHLVDAGQRLEHVARALQVGGVGDVHVRDLVVGDGERPRGPRVELLASLPACRPRAGRPGAGPD